ATHESAFSITGRVTEAGVLPPTPISGALVTIQENGRTATTNDEGVFSFSLLEGGSYTLRAEAGGFVTLDRPINVPATALNEYDIELSP
ncbi:MAG TPA: carboxypeptidase-like regulatory domain-containing protein, partial [Pyrinomonadaceae bacterium]